MQENNQVFRYLFGKTMLGLIYFAIGTYDDVT